MLLAFNLCIKETLGPRDTWKHSTNDKNRMFKRSVKLTKKSLSDVAEIIKRFTL